MKKEKDLKAADRKSANYLTWDEFMLFYNYEFDELEKDLELARDIFCFCCATSLSPSDLDVLSKYCFDNPDDPTSFTFTSSKIGANITIYLNEWGKNIYMKYKDKPTKYGPLFPRKAGYKMKEWLRKIAQMLNIDRDIPVARYCGDRFIYEKKKMYDVISIHTARLTSVVHCLKMGLSADFIMEQEREVLIESKF